MVIFGEIRAIWNQSRIGKIDLACNQWLHLTPLTIVARSIFNFPANSFFGNEYLTNVLKGTTDITRGTLIQILRWIRFEQFFISIPCLPALSINHVVILGPPDASCITSGFVFGQRIPGILMPLYNKLRTLMRPQELDSSEEQQIRQMMKTISTTELYASNDAHTGQNFAHLSCDKSVPV